VVIANINVTAALRIKLSKLMAITVLWERARREQMWWERRQARCSFLCTL
jgi:hypothetical protein